MDLGHTKARLMGAVVLGKVTRPSESSRFMLVRLATLVGISVLSLASCTQSPGAALGKPAASPSPSVVVAAEKSTAFLMSERRP
jgi:hypothetical protein